jgi:hypothetical protein
VELNTLESVISTCLYMETWQRILDEFSVQCHRGATEWLLETPFAPGIRANVGRRVLQTVTMGYRVTSLRGTWLFTV